MDKEPIIWWRVRNQQHGRIDPVRLVEEFQWQIRVTEIVEDAPITLHDKGGWNTRFYPFSFYPTWEEAYEHAMKLMHDALENQISSMVRFKLGYDAMKRMHKPDDPYNDWLHGDYRLVQKAFTSNLKDNNSINLKDVIWELIES
jgi:hypothetical protein